MLYFLNLMYGFFVLANLFGCLMYWVADLEGLQPSWIADHLDGDPKDFSVGRRYLASIYFAIVTVS